MGFQPTGAVPTAKDLTGQLEASLPMGGTLAPAWTSGRAEAVSAQWNSPPNNSALSGYSHTIPSKGRWRGTFLLAELFPVPPSLPAIGMLLGIGTKR